MSRDRGLAGSCEAAPPDAADISADAQGLCPALETGAISLAGEELWNRCRVDDTGRASRVNSTHCVLRG
jgi:hypothetical protein